MKKQVMKRFILSTLCLLLTILSVAQVPQYVLTSWDGIHPTSSIGFSGSSSVKIQCLYYPTDFPHVKTGVLTAIYLRIGNTFSIPASDPTVYDTFRVKIGYTTDSFFHRHSTSSPGDTFATGLTLIVNQPKLTLRGTDTEGKWIRFPIDANFYFRYDSSKRFIVEVSRAFQSVNQGFYLMASNIRPKREIGGLWDSTLGSPTSNFVMDLGLDFPPAAAVATTAGNLKDLYAYPNPGNGLFTVGYEAVAPVHALRISVYSVTGQCVYAKTYKDPASSFAENVDMRGSPKGVYLLRVEADGQTATRRVQLE
jgi:hypothetical protein